LHITTPDVSEKKANIEVVTNITNSDKKSLPVSYVVKILDSSGVEVGKSTMTSQVPAGQSTELKQVVAVENPALWSPEKPNLYHAEVELLVNGKVNDKVKQHLASGLFILIRKAGLRLTAKLLS